MWENLISIMPFFNGDILEDVYMEQLQCFVSANTPKNVWKVSKALYGLK